MKVQVNIVKKLNPIEFKVKKGIFYSVKIDLINNTDSDFKFWVMTCAWEETWVGDHELRLYKHGCDGNFPKIKLIEPGQKIIYNGIVHFDDTVRLSSNSNFKLGFVHIKENDVSKARDFYKLLSEKIKEHKDIIWSNSFNLDN